jgi:cell division transport system permease protein
MIWFALKEGWRCFRTLGIGGLLTLGSLTATLALGALTAEGYFMLNKWNRELLSKFEVEAFLNPDITDDHAQAALQSASHLPGVAGARFISRAEAANRFREQFNSNLLDLLGYNPLPPSIVLTLTPNAINSRTWGTLAIQLKNIDGVDDVVYQGELLGEVDRFYSRAGKSLLFVIGGTLVVSFIFTTLTISAAIKSRSDFIRIVLMCGGSTLMAKGPFIALGGYYGAAGGLIASGLAALVSLSVTVGWGIEVKLPMAWIPLMMLAGVLMAASIGEWVAARRIRNV